MIEPPRFFPDTSILAYAKYSAARLPVPRVISLRLAIYFLAIYLLVSVHDRFSCHVERSEISHLVKTRFLAAQNAARNDNCDVLCLRHQNCCKNLKSFPQK